MMTMIWMDEQLMAIPSILVLFDQGLCCDAKTQMVIWSVMVKMFVLKTPIKVKLSDVVAES